MKIKKVVLSAGMVLATVAAFVPAMASATPATWTHEHKVLTSGTPSSAYEGFIEVEIPGVFTYGCEDTFRVQAAPGTTGIITEFRVTTKTCVGTGAANDCTLSGDAPEDLAWTVHTTTHDFEITDMTLLTQYKAGCGLGAQTTLHFPQVTAQINNATTIGTVTVSGTATNSAILNGTLLIEGNPTIGIQT